ncbi:MAG: GNAT family N-acetyltransferase [Anaerolineales bacterium]|nr:GNAT family N-acetyltransferase [Anaerolineales bacterium]
MAVGIALQVRPAVLTDQSPLARLLHLGPQVHRHLDWRTPLDWIGTPPFLLAEQNQRIVAALACPPDPGRIAWIRLFVNSGVLPLDETWAVLWQAARQELDRKGGGFLVAAIALQAWLRDLLQEAHFDHRQDIVMLERSGRPLDEVPLPEGISVRLMMTYDLPVVAEVDALAFEPLWQNSLSALNRAYPQAVVATLAEKEGRVLAYQISTPNPLGAHLARLAVRPEAQGLGLGYTLVADLLQRLAQRNIQHLTVNTQSDNVTSLNLYRKIGFRVTDEHYPVYVFEG